MQTLPSRAAAAAKEVVRAPCQQPALDEPTLKQLTQELSLSAGAAAAAKEMVCASCEQPALDEATLEHFTKEQDHPG